MSTRFVLAAGLTVALAVSGSPRAEELAPGVSGDLYVPQSSAPSPAVIILHGRDGVLPEWKKYAERLQQNGYVSLVLNYQTKTGRAFRVEEIRKHMPSWVETVANASSYLKSHPSVSQEKVGIIGFSLGGFVAVQSAGTIPGIDAVVVYYGGGTSTLPEYASKLPPVLIFHGERDTVVPLDRSTTLYETMKKLDRPVVLKMYPGVGHCFDCRMTHSRAFNSRAAADAEQETLKFLSTYLK